MISISIAHSSEDRAPSSRLGDNNFDTSILHPTQLHFWLRLRFHLRRWLVTVAVSVSVAATLACRSQNKTRQISRQLPSQMLVFQCQPSACCRSNQSNSQTQCQGRCQYICQCWRTAEQQNIALAHYYSRTYVCMYTFETVAKQQVGLVWSTVLNFRWCPAPSSSSPSS